MPAVARRVAPIGASLAVLVLLLALGEGGYRWTRNLLVRREHQQDELRLAPYANALSVGLHRRVGRLSGLRSLVESARSLDAINRAFPVLAIGLMEGASGVRAIELVKGGRIRWVYPTRGNEEVIGYDLMADPRPVISEDVRRALASGQVTITGPVPLVQGGVGLIARQRIATRNPAFPELAAVVVDFDSLLAVAGLSAGVSGLDIAVIGRGGAVLGRGGAKPPRDSVAVRVPAPDGDWSLVAAPAGGWDVAVDEPLRIFRISSVVFALLISGLAFLIVERQSRLTSAVAARTIELQRANAELEHEVREREEAEEALLRREEQLLHAQKMEAMGTLAGGIAHDFNNVLTAIIGFSGLALDRTNEVAAAGDPTGEVAGLRQDIEEILRAAEHASVVTNQLLAFSRKQPFKPEPIDTGALVRETEVLLARVIGERVRLETRIEPRLPMVQADRGQLTQVLVNLAVNARDAMPDGGRLKIEARSVIVAAGSSRSERGVPDGHYVEIEAGDTGHGMPPDVLKRIFEPFFTTKGLGKGTGLGLSTVYGIVLRLGGRLLVESDVGKGSTFRVLIPAVLHGSPEEAPVPDAAEPTANSERILVVEDEPGVRQLTMRLLARLGYDVIAAASGEEALTVSAANPGRIHLLLTDLVMPGMSGRETALKLTAARPGMRVLFMSGYSEESGMFGGLDEGRATLLPKPFTPESLARTVRQVLDTT